MFQAVVMVALTEGVMSAVPLAGAFLLAYVVVKAHTFLRRAF